MRRNLLLTAVALALFVAPASAGAPAPPLTPAQKFAASQVVVTGKVTAIEKEMVDAPSPYVGAKDKVAYKIAVVKIDGKLAGAENLTHIKVGFVPPDPNAPPIRGSGGVIRPREPVPQLKEGAEVLVYLGKHPTAEFHVMSWRNLPVDLATDAGKKELEEVKKLAVVMADPLKALKSDKAEARAGAAAALVAKYRAYPAFAASVESVPVAEEESRLVLKALAEGDWGGRQRPGPTPVAIAFYQLGLTDKDGWKPPMVKPGENYLEKTKEAFAKWLDGPGKDYRLKKIVPKKQ